MLVTARSYAAPRRMGRTKVLEQSGDTKALLEYMAKLSEAHGDHEEAAMLRKKLNPERVLNLEEPTYTESEPVKPARIRKPRKRKSPAPSVRQQLVNQAWEELKLRRASSS